MSDDALGSAETAPPLEVTDETVVGTRRDGPVGTIDLREGAKLGRYLVLAKLGAGGMGVVCSAYDPELDRKVAIKLLLPTPGGSQPAAGSGRLLREAQAMAKLSHPNVVAVHDVGTIGERVYVAMEHVSGQTLRQWSAARERGWQELLRVFIDAGRGLAAAHADGIVHRDFKPDNVMVDDRGRVRVMDFGLAYAERSAAAADAAESSTSTAPRIAALGSKITHEGAVMGTPAYMSPEQWSGRVTDASTDQFSFAVALWEALYGERPFSASSVPELVQAVVAGAWSTPKHARRVPRWLRRALERGLRAEPAERWPSMDAMLVALTHDAGRTRRAWLFAAATGVVAIGGLAWWRMQPVPCRGAEQHLAGVWDETRVAAVETAILATELPYARGVWQRIRPRLDAWADTWKELHTEACEATRIRGEQSETVMDLRISCLQRALADLDAAAGVLSSANEQVVFGAHDLVAGLPALERCADVEALQADVPPPVPDEAMAVAAIHSDLAQSAALRIVGRFGGAEVAVERASAALEPLAYAPVHTEVALEHGRVLDQLGRYEEAERELRRAQNLGAAARQWREVGDATSELIMVLGSRRGLHEQALVLADLAVGLSAGSPAHEAGTKTQIAAVLLAAARYEEAEAEFRAAATLCERAYGAEDPAVAVARSSLAAVLSDRGKYREAEAEERAALAIFVRALGPDHPDVATATNNLAAILGTQGREAEAEVEQRAALAIFQAALGPKHPDVAMARNNLAVLLSHQGKNDEAEVEQRAALALRIETLGADHALVGQSRNNLAIVLRNKGDFAGAEAEQRRALAVREQALGPEHPDVAQSRHNLALDLAGQDKLEEAEAEHRAALAMRERALGPEHPAVAGSLAGLGVLLIKRGRPAEAVPLLERALVLRERAELTAELRADVEFPLARALALSGQPARARTVAEHALESYRNAGKSEASARVEAWLHDAE